MSKTNHFHLIERDGQELMTGGFIITDTPQIRGILDDLPITMQYDFVCDFKKDPFVKLYEEQ